MPPERLLAAAAEGPIQLGLADAIRPSVTAATVRWEAEDDLLRLCERWADLRATANGTQVTIHARYRLGLPFFGWLFEPLARRAIRRSLDHVATVLAARAVGEPDPRPRRPLWAPPDRLGADRAASIAAAGAALVVAGYGGSLLTQSAPFVARTFDLSDADLGTLFAITRVGTLLAILASGLSDRAGRRRVLLGALWILASATAVSALAPSAALLAMLQVIVRGALNVVAVTALVFVVEEAPRGARAYLLALTGVAGGAGFAVGAILLPLAGAGPGAWRWLFVFGGFGLLVVPAIARRLEEPARYLAARAAGAPSAAEGRYRRRFWTLAAVAFLGALFAAPSFQLTNRYLADERGLSAGAILVLRSIAQGPAALAAAWAGGRLAESRGRRSVAVPATTIAALATAGFFLAETPALLVGTLLVASVSGGLGAPAVATLGGELFPTAGRGRAGAGLLAAGVAGSVTGLLLVGRLAAGVGLGRAVALTALAPIAAALLLLPRLPEGRNRDLDDLSP